MSSFKILRQTHIQELSSVLSEFVHEPSGARIFHLFNDDPENLFCIGLRTDPYSSNGIAHILEHVVLCGSKKFPVKDPFFSMIRRSMQTFMNAMTGHDFTCYPAASILEKDFYNLLEVYLDAVFSPEIKEMSFLQEGWRLELSDEKDLSSPLQYKGIVFNEMKGAMQNPFSRLWQVMMEHLMPETIYAHNSGGDPLVIPTLTWEELKDFHKKFYHPSRALFYFYGNIPFEKHCSYLEKHLLKNISQEPALPALKKQTRFTIPVFAKGYYPFNEQESEHAFAVEGFLTAGIADQETLTALQLSLVLLLNHDASPLKAALIASGLCKDVMYVLDHQMHEAPLLIICSGVDAANISTLRALFYTQLQEIIAKGFCTAGIEAALHQMELTRCEVTPHYGLELFWRSGLLQLHGADPISGLIIHSLFAKVRESLKDPLFLPNLIEKWILKNTHRVSLDLLPSATLHAEEESKQDEQLKAIHLNEQERSQLKEKSLLLEQFQHAKSDPSCLPQIHLNELPKEAPDIPLTVDALEKGGLFSHEVFTNGLTYIELKFNLPPLQQREILLCGLLTTILPQLGTKQRGWKEQLELLECTTGGIFAACKVFGHINASHEITPLITLYGKALDRNAPLLAERMYEYVQEADFSDTERIWQLLKKHVSKLEQTLANQASHYSKSASLANLHLTHWLNEQLGGYSHMCFAQSLLAANEQQSFAKELQALHAKLFYEQSHRILFSASKERSTSLLPHLTKYLIEKPLPSFAPPKEQVSCKTFVPVPATVAFNSLSIQVPFLSVPLEVAARLMHLVVLHPKIREQQGAYGSRADYHSLLGTLTLSSYRDPQIEMTFKIFEEALHTISNGDFTEEELQEAKLLEFQRLDAPSAPNGLAQKAFNRYISGADLAWRQLKRNELFATTKDEICEVVKQVLTRLKTAQKASFAGEPQLISSKLM